MAKPETEFGYLDYDDRVAKWLAQNRPGQFLAQAIATPATATDVDITRRILEQYNQESQSPKQLKRLLANAPSIPVRPVRPVAQSDQQAKKAPQLAPDNASVPWYGGEPPVTESRPAHTGVPAAISNPTVPWTAHDPSFFQVQKDAGPEMTSEAIEMEELFKKFPAPPAEWASFHKNMYWKLAKEGKIQPGQALDPWRDLKPSEHSDMPVMPSVAGIIFDEVKRQASRLWNSSFVPGQSVRLGEDIGTRSERLQAQDVKLPPKATGEPVVPPFMAPPAGASHQRNATPAIEGMTPELARALKSPPQSLKTLGAESADPYGGLPQNRRVFARSYALTPPPNYPAPDRSASSMANTAAMPFEQKAAMLDETESLPSRPAAPPVQAYRSTQQPAAVPPGMKWYTEADFNPEVLKAARSIREIGRKIAADNQRAREAESFPALQAEGKKQAASDVASAVSRAELAVDADKQGMTGEQLSDYRQSLKAMNAPLREEITRLEAEKQRAETFPSYGKWAGVKQLANMMTDDEGNPVDPVSGAILSTPQREALVRNVVAANTTDSPSSNSTQSWNNKPALAAKAREERRLVQKDRQDLVKQRAMLNAQARRLGAGGMLLTPQQDDAFGRMAPALINMLGGIKREEIAAQSAENVANINAATAKEIDPVTREQLELEKKKYADQEFTSPAAKTYALQKPGEGYPGAEFGIDPKTAAKVFDMYDNPASRNTPGVVSSALAAAVRSARPNFTESEVDWAVHQMLKKHVGGNTWLALTRAKPYGDFWYGTITDALFNPKGTAPPGHQ